MPDWGAVAAGAAPYIVGALSTGGEIWSAQQNREEARQNRLFQERMSSTAAQRAVKDYAAAGLNPALAYDRSASSPGGAQATIGNPLTAGVSNALAVKNQQVALKQAAVQLRKSEAEADAARTTADHTEQLLRAQIGATRAQESSNIQTGALAWQNILNLKNELDFKQRVQQPASQKLMEADVLLKSLGVPRAQNDADYERLFNKSFKGISNAKDAQELLQLLLRRALR